MAKVMSGRYSAQIDEPLLKPDTIPSKIQLSTQSQENSLGL